jgi:hypothetical protein
MDLDRTTVLMSIRPVYADRIMAGEKTVEFRRKPLPEAVTTVLIWRTAKGGGLIGRFRVASQLETTASTWMRWVRTGAATFKPGIDPARLCEYAGGPEGVLWGIRIADLSSLQRAPLDPKALHPALHRPPQSWRYAPAGWETKVEVPW